MTGLFQHVRLAPARTWASMWLHGRLESHCAGSGGPCSPAGGQHNQRLCKGHVWVTRAAVGTGRVTIPPWAGMAILASPVLRLAWASVAGPFFSSKA